MNPGLEAAMDGTTVWRETETVSERAFAIAPDRGMAAAGRMESDPSFADALWVDVVDAAGFARLREEWSSLCRRAAAANVFMDPAVAVAVAGSSSDPVRILLVWHQGRPPRQAPFLVGVWMAVLRPTRLTWPFQGFVSPITHVANLGTPVVDAAFVGPAFALLLAALRDDPSLPKLVEIGDFNAALLPDFSAALAQAGMGSNVIDRRRRARLLPCADPAAFRASSLSKTRQRNLDRQKRQLRDTGKLEQTVSRMLAEILSDFEEFLMLEASGWKGARRSAMASDEATATAARSMLAGLARQGLVMIHALRLDGRPVAMGIVLYSGTTAFTWRTAYDEAYRRFSPGVLLLEETTALLLRDAQVSVTDSCNHRDEGFQADRWPDRHELVDLLVDVCPGRPLKLALLTARERAIRRSKEALRRHLQGGRWLLDRGSAKGAKR